MTTGRIPSVEGGIQPTIIDAAGDLIYGASNDTPARLAIGTAGQVLTVNSGATAPEWATPASGSLTQIATQNMAGLNTVTFSTIPQTYRFLVVQGTNLVTAANQELAMRFNGVTSSTYFRVYVRSDSATANSSGAQPYFRIGDTGVSGAPSAVFHTVPNYTIANTNKGYFGVCNNHGGQLLEWHIGGNSTDVDAAVTSITVYAATGGSPNFTTGTITLFGGN